VHPHHWQYSIDHRIADIVEQNIDAIWHGLLDCCVQIRCCFIVYEMIKAGLFNQPAAFVVRPGNTDNFGGAPEPGQLSGRGANRAAGRRDQDAITGLKTRNRLQAEPGGQSWYAKNADP